EACRLPWRHAACVSHCKLRVATRTRPSLLTPFPSGERGANRTPTPSRLPGPLTENCDVTPGPEEARIAHTAVDLRPRTGARWRRPGAAGLRRRGHAGPGRGGGGRVGPHGGGAAGVAAAALAAGAGAGLAGRGGRRRRRPLLPAGQVPGQRPLARGLA